jgi:hypothetical protein
VCTCHRWGKLGKAEYSLEIVAKPSITTVVVHMPLTHSMALLVIVILLERRTRTTPPAAHAVLAKVAVTGSNNMTGLLLTTADL